MKMGYRYTLEDRIGFSGMIAAIILFVGVFLACVVGWVLNIVALVAMVGGEITTLFVLRCIGVFFGPLGVVLGLFV